MDSFLRDGNSFFFFFHFLSAELQAQLSKFCFSFCALCIPFEGDFLVLSSPVSCVFLSDWRKDVYLAGE